MFGECAVVVCLGLCADVDQKNQTLTVNLVIPHCGSGCSKNGKFSGFWASLCDFSGVWANESKFLQLMLCDPGIVQLSQATLKAHVILVEDECSNSVCATVGPQTG